MCQKIIGLVESDFDLRATLIFPKLTLKCEPSFRFLFNGVHLFSHIVMSLSYVANLNLLHISHREITPGILELTFEPVWEGTGEGEREKQSLLLPKRRGR